MNDMVAFPPLSAELPSKAAGGKKQQPTAVKAPAGGRVKAGAQPATKPGLTGDQTVDGREPQGTMAQGPAPDKGTLNGGHTQQAAMRKQAQGIMSPVQLERQLPSVQVFPSTAPANLPKPDGKDEATVVDTSSSTTPTVPTPVVPKKRERRISLGFQQELVFDLNSKLLGESIHAQVYPALYRHRTEKQVAVKMWRLPQDEEEKEYKLEQLSREVAHLQTLAGDVSVKIYAFKDKVDFDWFEAALLVMDRCEMSLGQYVQELSALNDDTWYQQLQSIIFQLLNAYRKCHNANICHRDVKPENILVNRFRDGSVRILLCDFAFSQIFDDQRSSMHTRVGTWDRPNSRCWMAPEMDLCLAKGEGSGYDFTTDIWSLGCVIYFLATRGQALFRSPTERDDEGRRAEWLGRGRLINRYPLVLDLVDQLTKCVPESRLRLADALVHPATWNATFLCTVVNELGNEVTKSGNAGRRFRKTLDTALGPFKDWFATLPRHWQETISVPEDKTSPSQLLRQLRNLRQHLPECLPPGGDKVFADKVVELFPAMLLSIAQHFRGRLAWEEIHGHSFG